MRADGRGLGSIDLRCWREVDDERVIVLVLGVERREGFLYPGFPVGVDEDQEG